jgi:hypothetical protein
MRSKAFWAAALAAAGALTAGAARAADELGCADGYRAESRKVRGEALWLCVGEARKCADGYAGQENPRTHVYGCSRVQAPNTKCEGSAAGSVVDGKLVCQDPASRPPSGDYRREKAGPNAYRFVSAGYCPKGYRFTVAWNKQTVCAGPEVVACGDGYVGVDMGSAHSFCGRPAADRGAVCPDGGHPNRMDTKGLWYCVEPDADKCPKDRRYRIGRPTAEAQFRCLFASQ